MKKSSHVSRNRRFWAAIFALLGIMIWWRLRSPGKDRVAPEPDTASEEHESPAPAAVASPTPSAAPEPAKKALSDKPLIDEIIVEKPSVCEGEENLITVRAHTENGQGDSLRYSIGTGTGNPYPLRRYRYPAEAHVPDPVVRVFAGDGNFVVAPIPKYEVRNCVESRSLHVTAKLRPNSMSEFTLHASIVELTGKQAPTRTFTPAKFVWDFGDGTSETTAGDVVVHSYDDRPQSTLQSDFVVTARAVSSNDVELVGRTMLSLRNPAYEMASKGTVAIMVDMNPRFPTRDATGNVTEEVHLWHLAPGPVTIDRVLVTRSYGSGQVVPAEPQDPSSVLGSNTIPPGKEGLHATMTLSAGEDPNVTALNYEISGHADTGFAITRFSLMRPPPRKAITDPQLLARIARAQDKLHKDTFTFDEIAAANQSDVKPQGR